MDKTSKFWLLIIGGGLFTFLAIYSFVPSARISAPSVNFDRRFCEEPSGEDRTKDGGTPLIKFPLKEGCFAWDYSLPNVNWSGSEEMKSRAEGDWASVWCKGRPNPSRVYYWYEDFHDEFQYCRVFALQGKGWIAFKRL